MALILFLAFQKSHQLDDVTGLSTGLWAVAVGNLRHFTRGCDQKFRRLCEITAWLPIAAQAIRSILVDAVADRNFFGL